MKWVFAIGLLMVAAAGDAAALEGASTRDTDQVQVMEAVNSTKETIQAFLTARMKLVSPSVVGVENCGKQSKFYNESTKQCQ